MLHCMLFGIEQPFLMASPVNQLVREHPEISTFSLPRQFQINGFDVNLYRRQLSLLELSDLGIPGGMMNGNLNQYPALYGFENDIGYHTGQVGFRTNTTKLEQMGTGHRSIASMNVNGRKHDLLLSGQNEFGQQMQTTFQGVGAAWLSIVSEMVSLALTFTGD